MQQRCLYPPLSMLLVHHLAKTRRDVLLGHRELPDCTDQVVFLYPAQLSKAHHSTHPRNVPGSSKPSPSHIFEPICSVLSCSIIPIFIHPIRITIIWITRCPSGDDAVCWSLPPLLVILPIIRLCWGIAIIRSVLRQAPICQSAIRVAVIDESSVVSESCDDRAPSRLVMIGISIIIPPISIAAVSGAFFILNENRK